MNDYLNGKKHVHFIGIGGSGMFPLAQILHGWGYFLTGSDNNETDTLNTVREMGIPVMLGQRAENIEGADLIVCTAAIMDDNPELIAAKESGVPLLYRSEMLALIADRYKKSLCISGTHGKTTTTGMVTQILLESGIDPSAVIGGKLPAIGGSGRAGKSDTIVVEACEFKDSFLTLTPAVAVILNIDADHLDYFGTLENIIASFTKFISKTTGTIIANGDDSNTMQAVNAADMSDKKLITFGFKDSNDYYPQSIRQISDLEYSFELMYKGKMLTPITIHVAGEHNVLNAVASCAAALECGADCSALVAGLAGFHGTGRRFEKLGVEHGITIVDDYAHHPTELAVTLRAAKAMSFNRVWAVFQPFTYSRTAMLLDDFADALSIADKVVLTEIMGSREKNTYNIYSADLAKKISGCEWFETFEQVADYVCENAKVGDLIITLGCGDVYKVAKIIIKKLKNKAG